MTTMDGSGAVTPSGDDGSAMGLLNAIRAQDASEAQIEQPDEGEVSIDEPSEPSADQPKEEPKEEPAKDAEDYIEIPVEGGEPQRVKVADAIEAYNAYQALEGKVSEVISSAEERVSARAQQVYEEQDKMLTGMRDTLQVWHEGLRRMAPQAPSADMLNSNSDKYNPDAYHQQMAHYNAVVQAFGQIDGALKTVTAEQQRVSEEKHARFLDTEMERLYRHEPEWRTNFNGKVQEVLSVLSERYGFDEKSLFSIADHRFFRAASDIVKLHKMEKAAKAGNGKPGAAAPKIVRTQTQAKTPDRGADGKFQPGVAKKAASDLVNGPYTQDKGVNWFLSRIQSGQIK